jgi:hypothetical protein
MLLFGRLAVRSAGCSVGWLFGRLAVRSAGCSVGWLFGRLAVRSALGGDFGAAASAVATATKV